MKRSIFLLFVLLIGCAPAATVSPTATPLPPTSTTTPSPTATPEPTATPSAPREAGEVVQIFEGGKWVDLSLPETIWGEKPEGASIVLENGVPTLRMELNNFQTPDGDNFADIANYNKVTSKWELASRITVTRSPKCQPPQVSTTDK